MRARPGAVISTPITWEELVQGVKPDSIHLGNVRERLERLERLATDPWGSYFELRQELPP